MFYKAIEFDQGGYSSAYGMAAWCYARRKLNGWTDDQTAERWTPIGLPSGPLNAATRTPLHSQAVVSQSATCSVILNAPFVDGQGPRIEPQPGHGVSSQRLDQMLYRSAWPSTILSGPFASVLSIRSARGCWRRSPQPIFLPDGWMSPRPLRPRPCWSNRTISSLHSLRWPRMRLPAIWKRRRRRPSWYV